MLLDIANCRAVGGYFGWKTGFGQIRASFGDSFRGGIKVADTDELGYIGEDDLLTLKILWVYGLSAVVGSGSIGAEGRRHRGDGQKEDRFFQVKLSEMNSCLERSW